MLIDEAHRVDRRRRVVLRQLARKPERLEPSGKPDVEHVRVVPVVDLATARQSRLATLGYECAPVGDPAQRPNQEHHVVAQPVRRLVVYWIAAGPPACGDRAAIGVEQTLQHARAEPRAVEQVVAAERTWCATRPPQGPTLAVALVTGFAS